MGGQKDLGFPFSATSAHPRSTVRQQVQVASKFSQVLSLPGLLLGNQSPPRRTDLLRPAQWPHWLGLVFCCLPFVHRLQIFFVGRQCMQTRYAREPRSDKDVHIHIHILIRIRIRILTRTDKGHKHKAYNRESLHSPHVCFTIWSFVFLSATHSSCLESIACDGASAQSREIRESGSIPLWLRGLSFLMASAVWLCLHLCSLSSDCGVRKKKVPQFPCTCLTLCRASRALRVRKGAKTGSGGAAWRTDRALIEPPGRLLLFREIPEGKPKFLREEFEQTQTQHRPRYPLIPSRCSSSEPLRDLPFPDLRRKRTAHETEDRHQTSPIPPNATDRAKILPLSKSITVTKNKDAYVTAALFRNQSRREDNGGVASTVTII